MDGCHEGGPAEVADHPVGPAGTAATNPPVVATVLDRRPLSSEVTLRSPSSSTGLAVAAALPPPSSWTAVPPGSPTTSLQASNAELLRQEVFEKEQRLRERDAKVQEERWRQLESERLRALEQQQRRLAEEHQRQCEQREAERQQRRELELQRQEAERIEDQETVRRVQEAAAQRQLLREALQLEFQEADRAERLERQRFSLAQKGMAELLQRKRRGADPRRLRAAKEEQRALVKHQGPGLLPEKGLFRAVAAPLQQAAPRPHQLEPPRSLSRPAAAAAPAPPQQPPECRGAVAPTAELPERAAPPQRQEEEEDEKAQAPEAAWSQPQAQMGVDGPAASLPPVVPASIVEELAPVQLEPAVGSPEPRAEEAGAPAGHTEQHSEHPSEQRPERPESSLPADAKRDDELSAMCSRLHQSREVVLAESPETQESIEESPSDVQRKLDEDFAALEEAKLGNQETLKAADNEEVPSQRKAPQEEASRLQAAKLQEEDPLPEGSPLSWQSPLIDSAASPTGLYYRGTSEGGSLGPASPADRFEAREAEELRRERREAEARQLEAERAAKGEKKEADAFVVALLSLRKRYKDSDPAGLVTCLQTLRAYIKNLASNPLDRKFQRISCENGAFRSRVAPYEGAVAVLEACGFQPSGANLVVGDSFTKTKGPKLWDALSKLDVLLSQLKAAA